MDTPTSKTVSRVVVSNSALIIQLFPIQFWSYSRGLQIWNYHMALENIYMYNSIFILENIIELYGMERVEKKSVQSRDSSKII